ncbi:MAG: hypothetical protein ABJA81_07210 [Nocardioidaceae bacterium]
MRTRLIGTVVATAALALPMAAQAPSAAATTLPDATPSALASVHRHQATAAATRQSPVAAARDATRRFRSFRTAKHHGYGLFKDADGIACIAMPGMGAMGIHFVNGSLVGTPNVQLKHPEALVYARENGHRRLVALEYVVLRKAWNKEHGRNAPRPRLYGQRFNFAPAGNRFGLPPFYSLHAWIWKHNPAGRFAMFNPAVHCG